MKKRILQLATTGLFTLLASVSFADHLQENLLFSAKLTGAQEVPAVTTGAVGVASFMLNESRTELCVNVAVKGLSGAITGAHIHEGAIGVAGGVIIDLSAGLSGNQIKLKIPASDLTSAFLADLINGNLYINIHTAANPNGEIRGQILLETEMSYCAKADGAQEVPAVVTNAYGLGVFNLNQDKGMISYRFIAQGLSGVITGAHLHIGAIGVSGGVEQDLTTGILGNVISGSFVPSAALLTALMNGDVYINVHTVANPNGEIRGQLAMEMGLAFDANLNGAQEVPAVVTTAQGVASFTINPDLNEIMYDVVVDGLSGSITGTHIHTGAEGVAGGVIIDLSAGINGNRIMGTISGASVTNDVINAMLRGDTYVNVHTAANPNGEIRGQIYRLAREGFTASLEGEQEVPAVNTNAYGVGVVSISRNQDNLHYMFVVGGLTSALSGAHFHNAVAGVNGAVLFDITSAFSGATTSDSAFGYWTIDDATPFTETESALFLNNEIYVNVHNTDYLDGEIRGQINRGHVCYGYANLDELELESTVVYPNPFTNSISFSGENLPASFDLQIVDISGKIIFSENVTNSGNVLEFNTSSFENGTYFVHAISSYGVILNAKIVKM